MLPTLLITIFTLVVVLACAASIGAVWTNLSRLWTEIHVIKSSRQKYHDGLARQLLEFQETLDNREPLHERVAALEQKLQAFEDGQGLAAEQHKQYLGNQFARRDSVKIHAERIGKLEEVYERLHNLETWKGDILGELMGRIEQAAQLARGREERVLRLSERVGTLEEEKIDPAWGNKMDERVHTLEATIRRHDRQADEVEKHNAEIMEENEEADEKAQKVQERLAGLEHTYRGLVGICSDHENSIARLKQEDEAEGNAIGALTDRLQKLEGWRTRVSDAIERRDRLVSSIEERLTELWEYAKDGQKRITNLEGCTVERRLLELEQLTEQIREAFVVALKLPSKKTPAADPELWCNHGTEKLLRETDPIVNYPRTVVSPYDAGAKRGTD